MNFTYRQRDKIEERKKLEVLAFEAVIALDKYAFIEHFISPAITEYEKKFGYDGYIRHYAGRIFKSVVVERN